MRAVVFQDVGRVAVVEVPDPEIREPDDAVVRVSASAICGSDLHFYGGRAPMEPGEGIGHEAVGVVEEAGAGVSRWSPGDRVVVAFDNVCGDCWFCRHGQTSLCPDIRTFGAGPFAGDLAGAQAELLRVPRANVNLLGVPPGLDDDHALFVGDVLTTGYYGAAIAGIRSSDTVAVIGAGPVGFFCVQGALLQGAARVVALDMEPERLALAGKAGAVPVNVRERNPEMALAEMTEGRGADVVIEAVGSAEAFDSATHVVRRGGLVSVVGMYVSERAQIPLGVFWSRALDLRFAGICPIHAWWDRAMEAVVDGTIDPLPVISHRLSLEEAPLGYELFESRRAMKVVLIP